MNTIAQEVERYELKLRMSRMRKNYGEISDLLDKLSCLLIIDGRFLRNNSIFDCFSNIIEETRGSAAIKSGYMREKLLHILEESEKEENSTSNKRKCLEDSQVPASKRRKSFPEKEEYMEILFGSSFSDVESDDEEMEKPTHFQKDDVPSQTTTSKNDLNELFGDISDLEDDE